MVSAVPHLSPLSAQSRGKGIIPTHFSLLFHRWDHILWDHKRYYKKKCNFWSVKAKGNIRSYLVWLELRMITGNLDFPVANVVPVLQLRPPRPFVKYRDVTKFVSFFSVP